MADDVEAELEKNIGILSFNESVPLDGFIDFLEHALHDIFMDHLVLKIMEDAL